MFSLGCVLLEIVTLHDRGTLQHIRQNRSSDPSFHANLDYVETWLEQTAKPVSPRRYCLLNEIRHMLTRDAFQRPSARNLLLRISGCDVLAITTSKPSMFCDLCSSSLILRSEHEALGAKLKRGYKKSLAQQLKTTKLVLMQGDELSRLQAESVHMQEAAKTKENELRAECERLRECVKREQKEFAAVNDVQLRRITKLGRQLINQSAVLPVAETSSTTVHEELQKKTISAIPTAPKAARNVITVWEESSGSDDKHVRRTRHSAHRHPTTSSTRVITPAFSPASPRELLAVQKEYA
jgi:serine/threonine protein kinase